GRPWKAPELRKKSSLDLEMLYIILLKEKNMLISSAYHHRIMKTEMKYPERIYSVKLSVSRLKHVCRER
ncbi:mitochondrial 39-S ribosomal protein L47 (MRP-L47)-domain-containing protein, partial [Pavlovales sp. CCMP2436]